MLNKNVRRFKTKWRNGTVVHRSLCSSSSGDMFELAVATGQGSLEGLELSLSFERQVIFKEVLVR